ncbi:MAG: Arc family DNA-binding protein [Mesorhizobium sp.]
MDQKPEPLSVRLPKGMRNRIRERAAANRRSMNAEIVHYLDRALADQPEINGAASAATDPRHVTVNPA